MPDLVVWQRRETEGEPSSADGGSCAIYGEARLVEVKSPSDSLSSQSGTWYSSHAGRSTKYLDMRSAHAQAAYGVSLGAVPEEGKGP